MAGAEEALSFEREFLIRLASTWLACRLAVMGGTPLIKQHKPVEDFSSLGWAMLGVVDYQQEMRLLCAEEKGRIEVEECRRSRAKEHGGGEGLDCSD